MKVTCPKQFSVSVKSPPISRLDKTHQKRGPCRSLVAVGRLTESPHEGVTRTHGNPLHTFNQKSQKLKTI